MRISLAMTLGILCLAPAAYGAQEKESGTQDNSRSESSDSKDGGVSNEQKDTESVDVEKILEKVDDLWRGESSTGTVTMKVNTEHYQRDLKMSFWSRGDQYFLARIKEPKKEEGTATLKRSDEVYNYLPKINRVVKVGAAMMGSSWMGSHFTHDDLVQESQMTEDYEARLKERETLDDGTKALVIELEPKPDAPVVWEKVLLWVGAEDHLPIKQMFYGEEGELARTMTFSDVDEVGGRRLPRVLRVEPEEKPEEFTELRYEKIDFDASIDKDFFSLARLKHGS